MWVLNLPPLSRGEAVGVLLIPLCFPSRRSHWLLSVPPQRWGKAGRCAAWSRPELRP